jgi:hypothetical protein
LSSFLRLGIVLAKYSVIFFARLLLDLRRRLVNAKVHLLVLGIESSQVVLAAGLSGALFVGQSVADLVQIERIVVCMPILTVKALVDRGEGIDFGQILL